MQRLQICLCHSTNFYDNDNTNVDNDKPSSSSPRHDTKKKEAVGMTKQATKMTFGKCSRLIPGDVVYYRPIRFDKEQPFYGIFRKQLSDHHKCLVETLSTKEEELLVSQGVVVVVGGGGVGDNVTSDHLSTVSIIKVDIRRLVPVYGTTIKIAASDHCHAMKRTRTTTSRLLVVTPDTTHYRHLALSQPCIRRVLEVGCSTGQTSKILVQQRGRQRQAAAIDSWVGFDTSNEMLQTVQSQIPNATTNIKTNNITNGGSVSSSSDFCQTHSCRLDALVDPQQAKLTAQKFGPVDAVFLDIGGNRQALAVYHVLDFVLGQLPSVTQIICKSQAVYETLSAQQQQQQQREWIVDDWRNWLARQKAAVIGGTTVTAATSDKADANVDVDSAAVLTVNGTAAAVAAATDNMLCCSFAFPKHALKAPLRTFDGATPICRYHNYHKNGCRKWNQHHHLDQSCGEKTDNYDDNGNNNNNDLCPFDHVHCHWCLAQGHVALHCPQRPART